MRPTAVRRALGQHLRQYRDDLEMTVETASEWSGISQSKVTKIEIAQTKAKIVDVDKLVDVYIEAAEAEGERHREVLERLRGERERLHELCRAGQRKEWWEGRSGTKLPPKLNVYFGLEAAATRIEDYNPSLVHGLLQTEKYAYAVVTAIYPGLFEHRVRQLVDARMRRQELLQADDPLELWSIMDESVLRREVGGREVMHAQLRHLIKMASTQPNITLQVVRNSTGAHAGIGGQLSLLRFEPGAAPVGYVDSQGGNLIIDKEDELERFQSVIDRLRGTAPSPEDSMAFIQEIAEELKS